MLYTKDNLFVETQSPHSLGLKNALTIPSPGFDTNALMVNQKRMWGIGLRGVNGLFDGPISTWGIEELLIVGVIAYLLLKR
jgi:hypothetical protein